MKSYRKPHRYKKRKPIFRKKFALWAILALVLAAAVFYGLFFWRVFWVEKIIVSGEEKIAKDEIEFLVGRKLENKILFFKTRSIWAVDGEQIEKDILKAFPGIADVKIERSFFDAVSVKVVERTAVALWCADESCFLIDGEGIIFEKVFSGAGLIVLENGEPSAGLFLGENVIARDEINQIFEINSKLAAIGIDAKKAAIVSKERLNVETGEGWKAYFNLAGDIDWQVKELQLVLEKQISPAKRKVLEYIDLRFSRVYYK